MNNKEFIASLSGKSGLSVEETQRSVDKLLSVMTESLQNGDTLSLSGFGVFEVRKKMERVSVNPTTGKRMLIPPKLTLNYKPSALIKDRINAKEE
ncbi:MAG: HU family DNA-binding protein [Bacteroidaceae bacterium]|nr:HU family DNA-binding protein [Bacteroidaceae bacterium]